MKKDFYGNNNKEVVREIFYLYPMNKRNLAQEILEGISVYQKKNFLRLCMAIFFIVILHPSPALPSTIKINNRSAKFGENITFTVTLTSSSSILESVDFDIIFDNRMLKYSGFSKGPVAQQFNFFEVSAPSDNTLKLGGFGVNPVTINQDEALVYLNFTCVGNNEGKSSLAIANKESDLREWQDQQGIFTCVVEKNPETIAENTEPSTPNQTVAEQNPETIVGDTEPSTPNQRVAGQKSETIVGGAAPSSQNQTVSVTAQGDYRTSITRFSNGQGGEDQSKNERVRVFTNIPPASSPSQKSPQELNQKGYSGQIQPDNTINMGSRNEEGEETNRKNSGLTIIPKEYVVSESPQPIKEQVFDTSGLRTHLYNQYGEIPLVTKTFPKDGDILAIKDFGAIKFFFNQSMDNATVEKAFTINPEAEGRFEWKNRLTELDFIPSASLSPGVSYLICITDKAKDVYGRPLDGNREGTPEGNFCFTFKIEEKCEETSTGQEAVSISPRVSRCFMTTVNTRYSCEVTCNLLNSLFSPSPNHPVKSGYSSHTLEMLSKMLKYFFILILLNLNTPKGEDEHV